MNHKVPTIRKRLLINGIVQGVGFRPFVYTLAEELSLSGFISNSASGVEIEIEGYAEKIAQFKERLLQHPPPLAEITELSESEISIKQSNTFKIQSSLSGDGNQTLISPDMSICPDCQNELFDPNDRRFLYPFINCTNCGPRFTIIKGIPYDRPLTSMACFPLCPDCQKEYDDPKNRRFHAQPNACERCGPYVWFEQTPQAELIKTHDSSFDLAVEFLKSGKVLAIKGLGGFHLVVDALNENAVQLLRKRKNREQKPLALMMPDLESIQKVAEVDEQEKELLQSLQRPIVLLKRKANTSIAESVAPGNQRLGIMLPYTPFHYILFDRFRKLSGKSGEANPIALIFTSANRAEEPIVIDNNEARQRLADIADGFLMHNRDILVRADDSVLFNLNDKTQFFRRSRGYVPRPLVLKQKGPSILAVGAELKSTICILKEDRAFVSQHIGDLENLTANNFFEETVKRFKQILTCEPEIIVHDMHPGYFSSQWAKQQSGKKCISVQHHHAHFASCMAERHLDEPVIGLILDGAGYGYDQTIWGGEILVGDYLSIERRAWLEPMPMPGGEAAIKQPWRLAAGYLHTAFDGQIPELQTLAGHPVELITEMIEKKVNTPFSSSCGRLFDTIAALSGVRAEVHYEAQAAIEMMQSIESMEVKPYAFEVQHPVIPISPIIKQISQDVQAGQKYSVIAARFHKTLIMLFSALLKNIAAETGIKKIVLSGGVFQNEILLSGLQRQLARNKLQSFTQHLFPVNDGGISLGQIRIGQKLVLNNQNEVNYKESKK